MCGKSMPAGRTHNARTCNASAPTPSLPAGHVVLPSRIGRSRDEMNLDGGMSLSKFLLGVPHTPVGVSSAGEEVSEVVVLPGAELCPVRVSSTSAGYTVEELAVLWEMYRNPAGGSVGKPDKVSSHANAYRGFVDFVCHATDPGTLVTFLTCDASPLNPEDDPAPMDTARALHVAVSILTETVDALPDDMKSVALAQCGTHPWESVRICAGRNSATPPGTLAGLASDGVYEVVMSVAGSPSTPAETLQGLANGVRAAGVPWTVDSSENVLREVLRNPATPLEGKRWIVERLAVSDSLYSVWVAAHHPDAPPRLLAKLAKHPDSTIRVQVAGNPNTPRRVLTRLLKKSIMPVRVAAARNPSTSPRALRKYASPDMYR